MNRINSLKTAALALCVVGLAACGSTPSSPVSQGEQDRLDAEVKAAIADFRTKDPDIDRFFRTAYGYAIFPDVSSGALIVGGAHGNGEVFHISGDGRGLGHFVGYADVSKGNVGAQIGGQSYAQLVFFENKGTFAEFTSGKECEFDAKASAVAADKGASTNANYEKGVLVFTNAKGGLMVQAAIGGQKFRYIAADEATARMKNKEWEDREMRANEPRDSRDMPAPQPPR